jgi:ribosomal protein S12 methylthiotransferase
MKKLLNNKDQARNTVNLVSLGCSKNLVDSENILGALKHQGFAVTSRSREAEIIIVNTCGFIEEAKEESINTLLELGRYKQQGLCRLLVATGCLSQRYRRELLKLLPEVDAFFGVEETASLVSFCQSQTPSLSPLPLPANGQSLRLRSTAGPYAYLKIAEGCKNHCAYCAIPAIRGSYRSRSLNALQKEAAELVAQGARELVLVAQDTTVYGHDLHQPQALPRLIEHLEQIPELSWIRLLYCYPTGIGPWLLDLWQKSSKLCPYLDIPLQHIQDRILERMNRRGSSAYIRRLLQDLRQSIPGLALRTSLIVGFPGESEEDFRALSDFVAEVEFDHLGVFSYSREEGTPAYGWKPQISARVKKARQRKIMELQKEISARKLKKWVGQKAKVMIEGPSPQTPYLLTARLPQQAPEVDGCVYINQGQGERGQVVEVEITESFDYDLVGRIVS